MDLHDAGQLLLLVLSRKEGISRVELSKDASQGPHVNGHVVRHAQNDLGGAVETGLNVGVHLFILKTTASKINNLDAGLCWVLKQNVLGFKITMDDAMLAKEVKRLQELCAESKTAIIQNENVSQKNDNSVKEYQSKIDGKRTYRLMRPRLNPWKELLLMNSYKLIERSSEAIQRWLRK